MTAIGTYQEYLAAHPGQTMVLLDAIRQVHELYLEKGDPNLAFQSLLDALVFLTNSQYGLLALFQLKESGSYDLKVQAHVGVADNGLSCDYNTGIWQKILSDIIGLSAPSSRLIIRNDRLCDDCPGNLTAGYPVIQSFMCMPLQFGGELLGAAWIANRPNGYAEPLADWLKPLLSTCASIIHAEHLHEIERQHSKDALNESESRYRFLVQNTNDIILILDHEGVFRFISPSIERIAGYRPEDLEGQSAFTNIHPDDVAHVFELFTAKMNVAGSSVRAQYRYRHKCGTWMYFEADAVNLLSDPQAPGIVVSVRDITDRFLAQEELRKITLRQEALLSAIPDIVMEVDQNKTYTWANEAGREFFGDDVIGQEASAYFEGEQQTYAQVKPIFGGDESVIYVESWQRRKDGERRLLAWWCHVVKDRQGRVSGALSTARDITEHNWAEEKLRQNEERFRLLVQNSNDIITVLDAKGVQVFISGPLERLLGWRPAELIGTFGFERIHPDDVSAAMKTFMGGISLPGATRSAQYRHRHQDGRWIHLEAVGTNLLNDPVVKGIVLNIRDITERKQAEAEREKLQGQLQQAMKMEAVGRLAGGVAHDFNNLLTGITGNIELALLELNPQDPLFATLREVAKAAESAASLTRQLLAFSRKQKITPKILILNELIANMQKMLIRLIGEDITLSAIPGENLGAVLIDPGQFEQVLVNLAVNARDAMPHGGNLLIETANVTLDEVYCSRHQPLTPGPYVMLAVSDTGIGMSEEIRSRLFEPFFTTKPKDQGTGLGLATTYGAVKQAGGSIEVYSEPGLGTTFKIYLPRVGAPPERLGRSIREIKLADGNETVFIVEDDDSVRKLASKILARAGYRVMVASNGQEALLIAEKHQQSIHILMTDVVMPGMNGHELAEQLLKIHPETTVLYTSGYTEDVIVHHGVIDKDLNFLSKPYSPQRLTEKIKELIDSRINQ